MGHYNRFSLLELRGSWRVKLFQFSKLFTIPILQTGTKNDRKCSFHEIERQTSTIFEKSLKILILVAQMKFFFHVEKKIWNIIWDSKRYKSEIRFLSIFWNFQKIHCLNHGTTAHDHTNSVLVDISATWERWPALPSITIDNFAIATTQ